MYLFLFKLQSSLKQINGCFFLWKSADVIRDNSILAHKIYTIRCAYCPKIHKIVSDSNANANLTKAKEKTNKQATHKKGI